MQRILFEVPRVLIKGAVHDRSLLPEPGKGTYSDTIAPQFRYLRKKLLQIIIVAPYTYEYFIAKIRISGNSAKNADLERKGLLNWKKKN